MDIIFQFLKVTKEFVLTLFFSLFPILCGASVSAMWNSVDIKTAFVANFSYGEVFIYTSAFLTPYILTRLKEGASNLRREFCFYLFLYALFVGAFLFISVRLEAALSIKMSINQQVISWIGYTIVGATLVIWYFSIWPNYRKAIDTNKIQNKQVRDLDSGMSQLIGGEGD